MSDLSRRKPLVRQVRPVRAFEDSSLGPDPSKTRGSSPCNDYGQPWLLDETLVRPVAVALGKAWNCYTNSR